MAERPSSYTFTSTTKPEAATTRTTDGGHGATERSVSERGPPLLCPALETTSKTAESDDLSGRREDRRIERRVAEQQTTTSRCAVPRDGEVSGQQEPQGKYKPWGIKTSKSSAFAWGGKSLTSSRKRRDMRAKKIIRMGILRNPSQKWVTNHE